MRGLLAILAAILLIPVALYQRLTGRIPFLDDGMGGTYTDEPGR